MIVNHHPEDYNPAWERGTSSARDGLLHRDDGLSVGRAGGVARGPKLGAEDVRNPHVWYRKRSAIAIGLPT